MESFGKNLEAVWTVTNFWMEEKHRVGIIIATAMAAMLLMMVSESMNVRTGM